MKILLKKIMMVLLLTQLFVGTASAQSLQDFLRRCAWGTVIGAGVGFATLVADDKPEDAWGNVARGASLGLYAGIAYGVYRMNDRPTVYTNEYALAPTFHKGQLDGAMMTGTVFSF